MNLPWKIAALLLGSLLSITAFSQQPPEGEEWLSAVAGKHQITGDSCKAYGNHFVIGNKTMEGDLEVFRDAAVIVKEKDRYFIMRSEKVLFDPHKNTMNITHSPLQIFDESTLPSDPLESLPAKDYLITFSGEFATHIHSMPPPDKQTGH